MQTRGLRRASLFREKHCRWDECAEDAGMLTTLWRSWSLAQTCLDAAPLHWTHGHSGRRGTDFIEHMDAWQDSNKETVGSALLTCGKQLILAFPLFSRWLSCTSKEGRREKKRDESGSVALKSGTGRGLGLSLLSCTRAVFILTFTSGWMIRESTVLHVNIQSEASLKRLESTRYKS